MSNILDDTLAIENYRGLFIKNTIGFKNKKLSVKDYKLFKNEKSLHFIMRTTSPKDVCMNLTSINIIGKNIDTAISEANEERKQFICDLKKGVNPRVKMGHEGLITIEDLWNEYTIERVSGQTMTANYAKNNTYFFKKHLKPLFMPHKNKIEKIEVVYKDEEGKDHKDKITVNTPVKDTTGNLIFIKSEVVDIRDIKEADLQKQFIEMSTGSYIKHRVKRSTKPKREERYLEYIKYKPATAHQFIKVFKPMFEFAKKKKYIIVNPMDGLEAPVYQNARDFNLSKEKEKKLYEKLMSYPDEKFRAIFMFLLNGRRKNEVLTLKWEDVDFETNTYNIQYQNNKNKEKYVYELPEHLEVILKRLRSKEKKAGLVFTSDRTGSKIDNFDKRWNTMMEEIEISGITRHDLRHWIGNLSINMGKTTAEVAYALGHADERTAKRYAKIRPKTAAKVGLDFHKYYEEEKSTPIMKI